MKGLVRVVQALACLGAVVFVVMLFANEPDDGGDVVAVDDTEQPAGDEGTGSTTPPPVDGGAVYEDRCASCHGAKGQGQNGPKLADGRVVERFADIEDQIELVTGGKGSMPSFEDRLSEEEIRAVVEFTRSL